MKKVAFIINPSVRKVKNFSKELAESYLPATDFQLTFHYSESFEHINQLTKQVIAEEEPDIICGVGGIGTTNGIIQELAYTDIQFAIIPTGAGNAFARILGMNNDVKQALEVVKKGQVGLVDLGRVVNKKLGTRLFMSYCGFGQSPILAEKIALIKKRRFTHYFIELSKIFYKYTPQKHRVQFNFHEEELLPYEIFIGNIDSYGKNAKVVNYASTKDGILDIMLARKVKLTRLLYFLIMGYLGISDDVGDIAETFKANFITVYTEELVKIQLDFEPFDLIGETKIDVLTRSLKLLIPENFKL